MADQLLLESRRRSEQSIPTIQTAGSGGDRAPLFFSLTVNTIPRVFVSHTKTYPRRPHCHATTNRTRSRYLLLHTNSRTASCHDATPLAIAETPCGRYVDLVCLVLDSNSSCPDLLSLQLADGRCQSVTSENAVVPSEYSCHRMEWGIGNLSCRHAGHHFFLVVSVIRVPLCWMGGSSILSIPVYLPVLFDCCMTTGGRGFRFCSERVRWCG